MHLIFKATGRFFFYSRRSHGHLNPIEELRRKSSTQSSYPFLFSLLLFLPVSSSHFHVIYLFPTYPLFSILNPILPNPSVSSSNASLFSFPFSPCLSSLHSLSSSPLSFHNPRIPELLNVFLGILRSSLRGEGGEGTDSSLASSSASR